MILRRFVVALRTHSKLWATPVVMMLLVSVAQADTFSDTVSPYPQFDSASYADRRLKSVERTFADCPSGYSEIIRQDARWLLDTHHGHQEFWEYLYVEYPVTQVYFSLESSNAWGAAEFETVDVVFSAGSRFYWVRYSRRLGYNRSLGGTNLLSIDMPTRTRVERLSEDQVLTFLTKIDARYGTSSMRSHDVYTGQPYTCDGAQMLWVDTLLEKQMDLADTAMQEWLSISGGERIYYEYLYDAQRLRSGAEFYVFMDLPTQNSFGPVILFNIYRTQEFQSFYELSYFYDRLRLESDDYDPERRGEPLYLAQWVRDTQRKYGDDDGVVDSILQFWPPEVRPDLNNLADLDTLPPVSRKLNLTAGPIRLIVDTVPVDSEPELDSLPQDDTTGNKP